MARAHTVLVVLFAVAIASVASRLPAIGQEWLTNGDFEAGLDAWTFETGDPIDCEARSGNIALGIGVTAPDNGRVFHDLFGPLPAGTYTITGWTVVQSGTAQLQVALAFASDGGFNTQFAIPAGSGYEYVPFTVTATALRDADSARLSFDVAPTGTAEVCIDDLQITTQDPTPTATPTPSPTSPPGATATFTPTPTNTPVSATATNTATPAPSSATSTPTPSPTATPTLTQTPSPSPTPGPSFVFTNGGFEQGLDGWRKYGGELATTSNALSGSTAGLLTSDTESTKWAYQSVRVDPSQFYEFSGSLQADSGVKDAYLRISWYPTTDASGSAVSTSDSMEHAGPGGYVFLTTGAVQPPPDAASARVRIVLAPASAAPASLYIDDVSFNTTAAPSPTPMPSETPTPLPAGTPSPTPTFAPLGAFEAVTPYEGPEAHQEPVDSAAVQASAASASGEATTTAAASTAPTSIPVAEVASTRSQARASAPTEAQPASKTIMPPSEPSSTSSWPWIAGVGLLVFGLGGAYVQNKRTAR